MTNFLVLTVISDDRPGVVEILANTIGEHGGNWLECRMSHLAGKFAGILRISVETEKLDELSQSLQDLHQQGLKVIVETAQMTAPSTAAQTPLNFNLVNFNLVGNDRPGIVRELAQALASRNINVDELNTDYSSMPWSGDPMFTATGLLQIPQDTDMDDLQEQLDSICNELAVDITLEPPGS